MTSDQTTHYDLLNKLGGYEFAPRERLIVELILKKSFGLGRTRAYIPRLEVFVVMTRISRGNVSSILRRLIRCLVIEECAAGVYAVRLPVEQWKVPVRIQVTAAICELDVWLNQEPSQLEMLPEPPSLSQALREINFPTLCREGRGTDVLAAAQRYAGSPSDVQRSGRASPVPDLGTAVPDLGTACVNACKFEVPTGVPEVGTPPFKALKVHSLKPSEEAFNSELSTLKEGESEGKPLTRIGNEPKWMERVADLVGPKTMKDYGGWYRNRLRENQGKFERVLNAVALDKREGVVARNWGGHFYDLWGRFAD